MAKLNLWPRVLVIALLSGIIFISCNRRSDSSLIGVWGNTDGLIKQFHNNGAWEVSTGGIPNTKGTFTVDGNTITRVMTHLHGGVFNDLESRWFSESELEMVVVENNLFHYMVIFPFDRQTEIYTYSVSGDTVVFIYTGTDRDETEIFSQTFTRR